MKCRSCDYSLWNIAPGPCPECGEVFDPTGFDFPPGRIRFCCPHCDQHYFGDGEGGHLSPPSFECVGCGVAIEERECTARPVEGYTDAELEIAAMPWFDGWRSKFRRFVDTIGWSMVHPSRLGSSIPSNGVFQGGLVFAILVNLGSALLGIGSFALIMIIVSSFANGLSAAMGFLLGTVFLTVLVVVFSLLFLLLQGVVAHALLRITGDVRHPIGTTIGVTLFASGPVAISAVPCLGPTCLNSVSTIWAIVSGIIALRTAQGVSVGRAVFAGVFLPTLGLLLYGGFMIFAMVGSARAVAGLPAAANLMTLPQSQVVIGDRPANLDLSLIAGEIVDGPRLPSASTVLGGVGVAFRDGSVESVESTAFRGDGFDGWWIPGLLVIKPMDGAVVATLTRNSPTVSDAGLTVEMHSRVADFDGMSSATSMQGRMAGIQTAYENLVELVDGAGGNGPTLDETVVKAWLDASVAARTILDGREADAAPPESGGTDPGASRPSDADPAQSPPSSPDGGG